MACEKDTRMASYELILECYLSGQITEKDMDERLRDDEVFKAWLSRKMRGRAPNGRANGLPR